MNATVSCPECATRISIYICREGHCYGQPETFKNLAKLSLLPIARIVAAAIRRNERLIKERLGEVYGLFLRLPPFTIDGCVGFELGKVDLINLLSSFSFEILRGNANLGEVEAIALDFLCSVGRSVEFFAELF